MINSLQEWLELLEWSEETLLKHLKTVYERKLRDRERHKEYFAKNKAKIYAYHKKYREQNPGYVEKKKIKLRKNGNNQNTIPEQTSFDI